MLTSADLDFSEREAWQKERESLKEAKNKLEEQRERDEVKIKEFTVSKISGHVFNPVFHLLL